MEAELVATALTMKEAIFCTNMMREMRFAARLDSNPVYIDNTSTLHVAGYRAYSSRFKHVALWWLSIQKLVKEGNIIICYVTTEDQLADRGTKYLREHMQRQLVKRINCSRSYFSLAMGLVLFSALSAGTVVLS